MSYQPETLREPTQLAPANWYADPYTPRQWRWWSGTGWTDHVAPMSAAPAAPAPPHSTASYGVPQGVPHAAATTMTQAAPAARRPVAALVAAPRPDTSAATTASATGAAPAAVMVRPPAQAEPSSVAPGTAAGVARPQPARTETVAPTTGPTSLPSTDPLAIALRAITVADAIATSTGSVPKTTIAAAEAAAAAAPARVPAPVAATASGPSARRNDDFASSRRISTGGAYDWDMESRSSRDTRTAETPVIDEVFMSRPLLDRIEAPLPPERSATASAWLIALSPLLVLGAALAALYRVSTEGADWPVYVIAATPALFTVLLALADASALRRIGHWHTASSAWSLLGPLAYLIARVVRVGGSAPLWTWCVLTVLSAAALYFGHPYLPFDTGLPQPPFALF